MTNKEFTNKNQPVELLTTFIIQVFPRFLNVHMIFQKMQILE